MVPRSPRKKRVHLPGAARRFVPPVAAVPAAAAVAPTAEPPSPPTTAPTTMTPAAQEAKTIEPPVKAATAPTFTSPPATTAPTTSAETTAQVAVKPPATPSPDAPPPSSGVAAAEAPQPAAAMEVHAAAKVVDFAAQETLSHKPPPSASAATATAVATQRQRLGTTRRSRSRTTRRSSVTTAANDITDSASNGRSGTHDVCPATVAKDAAHTTALPPPSPPTAVATETPPAAASLADCETAAAVKPGSGAIPTLPYHRPVMSRLPKKKFFAELEGDGTTAEPAVQEAATTPTLTKMTKDCSSSLADAPLPPTDATAAPSRRATISRAPKKRARATAEVSAEPVAAETPAAAATPTIEASAPTTTAATTLTAAVDATPAETSEPSQVFHPAGPTPHADPVSAQAAASTRATISRLPKKRRFFAMMDDNTAEAAAVKTTSTATAATIEVLEPTAPVEEAAHTPAAKTAAAPAPATHPHRSGTRRKSKRAKPAHTTDPAAETLHTATEAAPASAAAPTEATVAEKVAVAGPEVPIVPAATAAVVEGASKPFVEAPAEVQAAATEEETTTATAATTRKQRTKPRKPRKPLSPAAQRRREIAALNRIPKRFRPLTPPWHARAAAEDVAAVEGSEHVTPDVATRTAGASTPQEVEGAALPTENTEAPSPHTSQVTSKADSAVAAVTTATPSTGTAATSVTGADVATATPAPAQPAPHVEGDVRKQHITKAPAHGKKRFFTTLEEAPEAASPAVQPPTTEASAALVPPIAPPTATAEETSMTPLAEDVSPAATPHEGGPAVPATCTDAEVNKAAVPKASVSGAIRSVAASEAVKVSTVEAADTAKEEGEKVDHPPSQPTPIAATAVDARGPTVSVKAGPQLSARTLLKLIRETQRPLKRVQRRLKKKKSKRVTATVTATAMNNVISAPADVAPGAVSPALETESKVPSTVADDGSCETMEGTTAGSDAEVAEAEEEAKEEVKATAETVVVETAAEAVEETRRGAPGDPATETAGATAPAQETEAQVAAEPTTAEPAPVAQPADEEATVSAKPATTTAIAPPMEEAPSLDVAAFPSPTARRLAAKKKIKKHAKLAAERLKQRTSPAEPSAAAVTDVPLVDAVHAAAEPPLPVADTPSAEALLRNAALPLPSGHVVMESFTEKEMVLRRATLDDNWDIGLRYDWQERTLTISAFPEFALDDARAQHPFVQLYRSHPRWLLKEVNEANATHMKEALEAMKRSLTARFVFRKLAK
jgi:hypothetical protein